MDKKKVSFYVDCLQHLELLTEEETGKVLLGIFRYVKTREIPDLEGMAKMAFSFLKADQDRQEAEYQKTCARNKVNGSKGGRPKKEPEENPEDVPETQGIPEKPDGFFENPENPIKEEKRKEEKEKEKNLPPQSPKGEQVENVTVKIAGGAEESVDHSMTLAESFSLFWEKYPRQVAKGAAEKAWNKLKPDDSLFANILSALEAQKRCPQWQKENGQYIPHPATWLNQRRWEDKLTGEQDKGGNRNDYARPAQPSTPRDTGQGQKLGTYL